MEAISIVDKHLEHARIFIFANGGDEKIYLSSADWMSRNFEQRCEIAVPIYDAQIKKDLRKVIDLQLMDNTKSRLYNELQNNPYKTPIAGEKKIRSQEEIYNYFKNQ
jgi:polyphosphate kinase